MGNPRNNRSGLWEKPKVIKNPTESPVTEYLQNTTFHGLREFALPDPTGFKIVWALVVLSTLGFMMYQIVGIINEYQAGTVITKFSTTSLNSTPPLLFCPTDVFDYWKAQAMGVNAAILDYIWGFFIATHKWDVSLDGYFSETEMVQVRTRYTQILNLANGTLSNLIKKISINTDSEYIGFSFYCSKCKVQPVSIVKLLATGICEFFEPAPFETSLGILGENPQIEINLDISNFSGGADPRKPVRNHYSGKIIDPDFSSYYYPKRETIAKLGFTFSFGDEAYQAVASYRSGLTLNFGRDYDIFLTTFVNHRINGCNKQQTKPKDCRADCIKRSIVHCSNNTCNGYVGEADDEPHKAYCNIGDAYWGTFDHTCAISHYQACIQQPCPTPCQSQTHQTSIFPGLPNGKMSTRIMVRPMGANAVIFLQDVQKYTFVSFVSNLGGLLGLFCGGSIVSLCHLLYYAVITLYKKNEKSTIEVTASENS